MTSHTDEVGIRGMDQKVVYMHPDELIPYERNAKIHGSEVEFLMNNIRELGFRNPIRVTKDMVITSGHGRLMAAKRLGMERVPVIIDEDFTEEEAKAYRLNDNQMSDLAGYDFELRDLELEELSDAGWDMGNFGFLLDDFDADGDYTPEELDDVPARPSRREVDDEAPEGPPGSSSAAFSGLDGYDSGASTLLKEGDIVTMGRHRLLCSGFKGKKDLETLLGGRHADVSLIAVHRDSAENDMKKAFSLCLDLSDDVFCSFYLGFNGFSALLPYISSKNNVFKDISIWAPPTSAGSDGVEVAYAFARASKDGSEGPSAGKGDWNGVMNGQKVGKSFVNTHTEAGNVILDLSGATMETFFPSEDLGRTWMGMEPDLRRCGWLIDGYIDRIGTSDGISVIRNGEIIEWSKLE